MILQVFSNLGDSIILFICEFQILKGTEQLCGLRLLTLGSTTSSTYLNEFTWLKHTVCVSVQVDCLNSDSIEGNITVTKNLQLKE